LVQIIKAGAHNYCACHDCYGNQTDDQSVLGGVASFIVEKVFEMVHCIPFKMDQTHFDICFLKKKGWLAGGQPPFQGTLRNRHRANFGADVAEQCAQAGPQSTSAQDDRHRYQGDNQTILRGVARLIRKKVLDPFHLPFLLKVVAFFFWFILVFGFWVFNFFLGL